MQLEHDLSKFKNKKFPICLVLDHISGEANIGSIFRLCDAFHVEELLFYGQEPNLNSNRLKRTARSTHERVPFRIIEEAEAFLADKKALDYRIIGLEITEESISLSKLNIPNSEKIVLIAGNENFGISDSLLKQCDRVVHIDMFGTNSSMNVAQAIGISLYEITKILSV